MVPKPAVSYKTRSGCKTRCGCKTSCTAKSRSDRNRREFCSDISDGNQWLLRLRIPPNRPTRDLRFKPIRDLPQQQAYPRPRVQAYPAQPRPAYPQQQAYPRPQVGVSHPAQTGVSASVPETSGSGVSRSASIPASTGGTTRVPAQPTFTHSPPAVLAARAAATRAHCRPSPPHRRGRINNPLHILEELSCIVVSKGVCFVFLVFLVV